jgi:hypothetical protein
MALLPLFPLAAAHRYCAGFAITIAQKCFASGNVFRGCGAVWPGEKASGVVASTIAFILLGVAMAFWFAYDPAKSQIEIGGVVAIISPSMS